MTSFGPSNLMDCSDKTCLGLFLQVSFGFSPDALFKEHQQPTKIEDILLLFLVEKIWRFQTTWDLTKITKV